MDGEGGVLRRKREGRWRGFGERNEVELWVEGLGIADWSAQVELRHFRVELSTASTFYEDSNTMFGPFKPTSVLSGGVIWYIYSPLLPFFSSPPHIASSQMLHTY